MSINEEREQCPKCSRLLAAEGYCSFCSSKVQRLVPRYVPAGKNRAHTRLEMATIQLQGRYLGPDDYRAPDPRVQSNPAGTGYDPHCPMCRRAAGINPDGTTRLVEDRYLHEGPQYKGPTNPRSLVGCSHHRARSTDETSVSLPGPTVRESAAYEPVQVASPSKWCEKVKGRYEVKEVPNWYVWTFDGARIAGPYLKRSQATKRARLLEKTTGRKSLVSIDSPSPDIRTTVHIEGESIDTTDAIRRPKTSRKSAWVGREYGSEKVWHTLDPVRGVWVSTVD